MLESLRAAVLKNPDDVSSLQVWADVLLEAGAPAAELVRASVASNVPIEVSPEHFRFFMGGVAPAIDSMTLLRGVPWSVSLRRLPPSRFVRILGRAEWETVHSIHFERGRNVGSQGENEVVALVTHPVMRTLREISGIDAVSLAHLGSQPVVTALESVGLEWGAFVPDLATVLPSLPRLSRLSCSSGSLEDIIYVMSTNLNQQLKSLRIPSRGEFGLVERLLESPGALEHFQVGATEAVFKPKGWSLTITTHAHTFYEVLNAFERQGARLHEVTLSTLMLTHALRAGLASLGELFGW